jgi:ATP adenylyltransferase
MERLWAPWREQYISKVIHNKHTGCVFCRMIKSKADAKNYVFLRGAHAYAVLNIYPYSNGHCLVVPNRHVNDISKMRKEELDGMMELLLQTKALLQQALTPHGFNVGLNLGRLAGAGIPGHVHMHIVPRWKGDHNFMPVTGQTKVISQSLDGIYKSLTAGHKKARKKV